MLEGQIALVTGASRGIGAAIARELGKQGATVIGTATSAGGAEQISQALQQAGIKGEGMALDVNDAAQVEAVDLRVPHGNLFADQPLQFDAGFREGPRVLRLYAEPELGHVNDGIEHAAECNIGPDPAPRISSVSLPRRAPPRTTHRQAGRRDHHSGYRR